MKTTFDRIVEESAVRGGLSKVYLGKREFKELNRSFKVIDKKGLFNITSNISLISTKEGEINVIATKHRSYFRAVQ